MGKAKNGKAFDFGLPKGLDDPQAVRDYFQKIISCMPNNVYWLNRECITQGCNKNVLKLVGLRSLDEFVGITYEEMGKLAGWTEGQAESFKRDDMEVMSTGVAKFNVEEPPLYDEKGNPVYYMSSRVPIFDDKHEAIGIVGISVDITELKRAEESLKQAKEAAEAANKAKTEFLENMRHDVRTPLTGIVGFANIIKDEADNQKMREYANNLIASSHALLDLMNEVLEAVKVSSGEIPILTKKFDLRKKLQEVINLHQAKARYKKIDLSFEYDKNLPTYFIGDPVRIHRIVLELVAKCT